MNAINPNFGRAMTHEEYANEWSTSAAHFAANGHYTWMAQQLGDAPTAIEIGCGSGASTLSLVKAGCRILCVEENAPMIDKALEYLQMSGIAAERIDAREMRTIDWANGPAVRIAHINVFDPALSDCLPRDVDALVCWLTGARPGAIAEQLGKMHVDFDGSEMPAYRLRLQAACYTLGRIVLKPGGVVHFVDRVGMRSWSDKDAMREHLMAVHSEMAGAGYAVTKYATFLRRIDDKALSSSNIKYVAPPMARNAGATAFGSVRAALT
ncbi:hypothetical protein [Variovorax sp. LT1R16]|uniref:hypothetical protein n=1 Tax=Variovorax sp. LT1R16 TaxID=3443728 RepID=UPI003F48D0A0